MHLMRSNRRWDIVGIYLLLLLIAAVVVGGLWWFSHCVELPYALLLFLYLSRLSNMRSEMPNWAFRLLFYGALTQALLVSLPIHWSLGLAYAILTGSFILLFVIQFVYTQSLYWSWRWNKRHDGGYNDFYRWFTCKEEYKAFSLRWALLAYWRSAEQLKQAPFDAYEEAIAYWEQTGNNTILSDFVREYAYVRATSPELYKAAWCSLRQLEGTFLRLWLSKEQAAIFSEHEYEEPHLHLSPFAFELLAVPANLKRCLQWAAESPKMRKELEAMLPLALRHIEAFMDEQTEAMVQFFRAPQRLEETEQALSELIPAIEDMGLRLSEDISEQFRQLYGLHYMAIGIAQNCA